MKRLTIYLLFMSLAGTVSAQSGQSSLDEKWNNMLNKAESYQHYKVIKKTDLSELWGVVQDSVSKLESMLVQERSKIVSQQNKIDQLEKQEGEVQAKLDAVTLEKDNMSFLGIEVDKYAYATILWVFIVVIAAGCGVLFFMFKTSNKVTVQKISEYDHLFNRFEDYKKSKIELERKLKRELQTQLNTVEELKRRQSRV